MVYRIEILTLAPAAGLQAGIQAEPAHELLALVIKTFEFACVHLPFGKQSCWGYGVILHFGACNQGSLFHSCVLLNGISPKTLFIFHQYSLPGYL